MAFLLSLETGGGGPVTGPVGSPAVESLSAQVSLGSPGSRHTNVVRACVESHDCCCEKSCVDEPSRPYQAPSERSAKNCACSIRLLIWT